MNIGNIIACLAIMREVEDIDSMYLCAEHDAIFFPVDNGKLSKKNRVALNKLGAHWDDDVESWSAFV